MLLTLPMDFPERLAALRKERGLTQAQLAERADTHVSQIRRYESGKAQPTLDAIRRLATTLHVSADLLVFDTDERGPSDDLAVVFEATRELGPEDRAHVRALLEGILLRHQSRRFADVT